MTTTSVESKQYSRGILHLLEPRIPTVHFAFVYIFALN